MMQILKEVTEWDWPNHTYLLDGKGYLIAYIKEGQDEVNRLSRLPFSKTGRKFIKEENEKLDSYAKMYNQPILNGEVLGIEEKFASWTVDGSKGNTYIVELIGDKYHCSCPGYGFRGKCKHSDAIRKENE